MLIRPLLNRRPLLPDESLPSLFERLRRVNYYECKTAIIDLCRSHMRRKDNVYQPQHADTWRIVAGITQLPLDVLYAATFHRYAPAFALPSETISSITLVDSEPLPLLTPHVERTYMLPLHDIQFCPRCMQESCYHRVAWLNALAAICPRHNCLLQRGCPRCGQRLNVAAVVTGQCARCETDLTAVLVVDMSDNRWEMWVQKKMQTWWGDAPMPESPESVTLPDQPTPVLLETLLGIVKSVAQWQGDRTHHRREYSPPEQIFRHYAIAMKALVNWPQGFHQFLDEYSRRPGVAAEQITVAFAPLYLAWLEKRWTGPEFVFIQEAFDDFLAAHYPLSRSITRLRRYRQSAALRDRFPYLTEAEAAERVGVAPNVIQRLVEIGVLVNYEQGENIRLHWHKRLRLVRRVEFEELQERWQDGISVSDVTRLLDVETGMVERLVEANLLAWQNAVDEDKATWKISPQALGHFFDKLHIHPGSSWMLMETVTLQQVVEAGGDAVTIIQYVMNGDLASLWFGGGLYEVQVSQNIWEQLSQS
jgi:hypothetical protein